MNIRRITNIMSIMVAAALGSSIISSGVLHAETAKADTVEPKVVSVSFTMYEDTDIEKLYDRIQDAFQEEGVPGPGEAYLRESLRKEQEQVKAEKEKQEMTRLIR